MTPARPKPRSRDTVSCNLRRVPTQLWQDVKVKALRERKTMREAIIEAMKLFLDQGGAAR